MTDDTSRSVPLCNAPMFIWGPHGNHQYMDCGEFLPCPDHLLLSKESIQRLLDERAEKETPNATEALRFFVQQLLTMDCHRPDDNETPEREPEPSEPHRYDDDCDCNLCVRVRIEDMG